MSSQAHRKTPFEEWRDQQRPPAEQQAPPHTRAALSPAREARRDLAIWAAIDAVRREHPEAQHRIEELLRVDIQVKAEQAAEAGRIPDTFDGCIAVLAAAARILETLGPDAIAELIGVAP